MKFFKGLGVSLLAFSCVTATLAADLGKHGEVYKIEEDLKQVLTVNGHSMSNPILDADGNVDMDASRRVEVKFRLKDDEMIDELNKIMSGTTDETETETETQAAE